MLWDFVLWYFVLSDFVRRDFDHRDSVPDSMKIPHALFHPCPTNQIMYLQVCLHLKLFCEDVEDSSQLKIIDQPKGSLYTVLTFCVVHNLARKPPGRSLDVEATAYLA